MYLHKSYWYITILNFELLIIKYLKYVKYVKRKKKILKCVPNMLNIFYLIIRYIVKNKLISLWTFSFINILDFTNLLLIKRNVIIYLVSTNVKIPFIFVSLLYISNKIFNKF